MRESRLSGSVEGVRSNPDPYSDSPEPWSSNNHSLLGSREPALLWNHVDSSDFRLGDSGTKTVAHNESLTEPD